MQRSGVLSLVAFLILSPGLASASIWPSAAARVERELRQEDPELRRRAAESIADLPGGAARRLLDIALADQNADVRLAAAGVAVRLRAQGLGSRLSVWLADPDSRIRLSAAEALAARPDPLALGALGRASSDADAGVRAAVARALGASLRPEAVVPLLGRLDDPVPEVRRQVVLSLGRLRDARAVIPLLAKVEDPAGVVRRAAARALGALGDARAVGALVLVLRDSDESVRVAAVEAVGRLGDPSAASSVIAALADPAEAVRSAAVRALGRLGTPEATAAVVAELARETVDPSALIGALRLSRERALPALRACVEARGGFRAADGCAIAVGALGDASDVPRIRLALERGEVSPRAALAALGTLGSSDAVPTVLERISDPDISVRRAALIALMPLLDPDRPDGRAVDPLVRALRARRQSAVERTALLALLGRTGSERAAAVLADVAKNATSPATVRAALDALGAIGPAGVDDVLMKALDHEDGTVRTAAALALRRSGSARVLGPLIDRLERAAGQDHGALALAIPGVMTRAEGGAFAGRLSRALAASRGAEREGLIEALGEAGPAGIETLRTLGRAPDPADRAKIAEVLSGRREGLALLRGLASDTDAATRAAAVWSLGATGTQADAPLLSSRIEDRNVSVAANAVGALGRLAKRTGAAAPALCGALGHSSSGVRANALAALTLVAKTCEPTVAVELLARDRSPTVRLAAARYLLANGGKEARDALARCADEDESARVAAACAEGPEAPASREESVLVVVMPTGETEPVPRAPFALRFADGIHRSGSADRRGAVYERRAPAGIVELLPIPGADD
jgi:HEAT repeat protein